MIIFETERLRVRQYHHGDGENFFELNGNPEVVRFIRPAKSREECDQFLLEVIESYNQKPLYGRWAVERLDSGEYIGSFSLLNIENTDLIHLGYALLPQHWGKGYATELAKHGLEYTFSQTPLLVVYAITEADNTGSIQVLKKTGFDEEIFYAEQPGKKMIRFIFPRPC